MPSSVASAAAMAEEMATVSCDRPTEGSAAGGGGGCGEESAVQREGERGLSTRESRGRGFSTLGNACDLIARGDCDCDARSTARGDCAVRRAGGVWAGEAWSDCACDPLRDARADDGDDDAQGDVWHGEFHPIFLRPESVAGSGGGKADMSAPPVPRRRSGLQCSLAPSWAAGQGSGSGDC